MNDPELPVGEIARREEISRRSVHRVLRRAMYKAWPEDTFQYALDSLGIRGLRKDRIETYLAQAIGEILPYTAPHDEDRRVAYDGEWTAKVLEKARKTSVLPMEREMNRRTAEERERFKRTGGAIRGAFKRQYPKSKIRLRLLKVLGPEWKDKIEKALNLPLKDARLALSRAFFRKERGVEKNGEWELHEKWDTALHPGAFGRKGPYGRDLDRARFVYQFVEAVQQVYGKRPFELLSIVLNHYLPRDFPRRKLRWVESHWRRYRRLATRKDLAFFSLEARLSFKPL